MTFLRLGGDHDKLKADRFEFARGCYYTADAFLGDKVSVKQLRRDLDYTEFLIATKDNEDKAKGVHMHCDNYGPWGAFEKTVKLLTDAKSKEWPLKMIFVVGCCGASISEQKKKKKEIWNGTILLANEVKSYLHTGKVEPDTDANASVPQVIIKGQPKTYEMEGKWLQPLKDVASVNINTGFTNIDVESAMYLSGPLVIKDQLFGDEHRAGQDIAGVEMEVIGVIKAVDAIHDYLRTAKEERPRIVLAKGISDCTGGKEEDAKCVLFGKKTGEAVDDDSRQVYATLQSIALVIRCVASYMQALSKQMDTT